MRLRALPPTPPARGSAAPRLLASVAVLACASTLVTPARAEDVFGEPSPAPHRSGLRWAPGTAVQGDSGVDRPENPLRHGEQRPFAYVIDPSIPLPGEIGLEYALQGASGVDAIRPLPANLGAQGLVHGATVAVGATRWLSVYATGLAYQPSESADTASSGTGQLGARLMLTRPDAAFRAGMTSTVLREFGGALGVSARAVASYDIGVLRMAGNAHAEKVFAAGRDGVDLLAFGGVSVKTTEQLRLGAEYVGQDLEDAFEAEEAEGGARHFAGPVAALELADGAFWITAGPAFGLNERSPGLLGRLSMLATF